MKDVVIENIQIALRAAQKIFYFVNEIIPKDSNKDINIGIGYGDCKLIHVGGVFGRTSFFTVGEALEQAHNSILIASVQKGIIVSKELWEKVRYLAEQKKNFGSENQNNHDPLINATKVHEIGQVKLNSGYDKLTQYLTSHPFLSNNNKIDPHKKSSLNYLKKEI